MNGQIVSLAYGKPCSVAIDPMEKKPLYHFFPGTPILSLGMAGCNLRCANCQNSSISQKSPEQVPHANLPPDALPHVMKQHKVASVAYTYTEPLVAYEYVLDCAKNVKHAGGYNVLVTAAYVQEKALQELIPYIDAANVDLKSIDPAMYQTNCKATLEPVLAALRLLHEAGVHLEITNLVIPSYNDTTKAIQRLVEEVASLSTHIPLHFSRFFPCHKLAHLPVTPEETLFTAANIAKTYGLHHVYVGNVQRESTKTLCPKCQTPLIVRAGFTLAHNVVAHGGCPTCQSPLYGRF